jgi:nucleotide-binding universal stress UspA family protein
MRAVPHLRAGLVALAGSPDDDAALDLGISLAGTLDLELTVVCVRPPARRRLRRLGSAAPVLQRHQDAWYEPALAAARQRAWEHGVAAELELVSGDRGECVVRAAETFRADVVIAGGWARSLAAKTPCPLLLATEAQGAEARGGAESRTRGWGAPAPGAAATSSGGSA